MQFTFKIHIDTYRDFRDYMVDASMRIGELPDQEQRIQGMRALMDWARDAYPDWWDRWLRGGHL